MTENKLGYKEEAFSVYDELNMRYPHKLKCGEDLLRIIELSYQFDLNEELDALAFSGKFSHGLLKIIQQGGATIEKDYFDKIKKEYAESLESVKRSLEPILKKSSDFFRKIFEEKYFSLSQEGVFNLSNLCSDLNYLKIYLNDKKRQ